MSTPASANGRGAQPPPRRPAQAQVSPEDLNRIVMEYLNKQGYTRTELMLRLELLLAPVPPHAPATPATTQAALPLGRVPEDTDAGAYARAYAMLRDWTLTSLDMYKDELERFMYPLFVHCFLELIGRGETAAGRAFFERFAGDHAVLHHSETSQLAGVATQEHVAENPLVQQYKRLRYRVLVLKTALDLLLYFLHEHASTGGSILIRIINQYLEPRVGSADTDGPIDADEFNEQLVQLGAVPVSEDWKKEVEAELAEKDPALVDTYRAMNPEVEDPATHEALPLPIKTAYDLKREVLAVVDARARVNLDAAQPAPPSTCMYTFHNTGLDMTCVDFNDDATRAAAGFADSAIRLWSIDGDPLALVVDEADAPQSRRLVGHLDAVYGVSFSPDLRLLLSASGDKTARLWSLDTYLALVLYKGHAAPVWDCAWSPYGFYFATALNDQTARLWLCDHIYPLRIFAGHLNDVDAVTFHPNLNYVFTGSLDKTCRMWDVATGSAARIFIGHTGAVNAVAASPDGRWLALAGEDCTINVWDIGSGRRLKLMRGHGKATITSLSFSQEGGVLVSGLTDGSVRVWDVRRGTAERGPEPEPLATVPGKEKEEGRRRREVIASSDHMVSYFTKKTPVHRVKFTRRNLVLAGGPFQP